MSFRFDMPWPFALCFAMYSGVCGGKWSRLVGVGHVEAAAICRGNWSSRTRPSSATVAMPGVSFQSRAEGVTHKLVGALAVDVFGLVAVVAEHLVAGRVSCDLDVSEAHS